MQKKVAAFTSILSNAFLIFLKLLVGVSTGSVSVISEAIHSLGDLIASFIAFFSVVKSSKPADEHHPFGHGKYEDLAGFVEALLIVLTAFYIFYIAIEKLVSGNYEQIHTTPAIAVMLFSILLNFAVSSYLYFVAKKTDSIALHTDAQHLSADIYSSLAILLGLLLVRYTGWTVLDPILALAVGVIILNTGCRLVRESMNNLLDGSLPKEEKKAIEDIVESFKGEKLLGIKCIKTSKSGPKKVAQMILYMRPEISLFDAHTKCDEIEDAIRQKFPNSELIIHTEPFIDTTDV